MPLEPLHHCGIDAPEIGAREPVPRATGVSSIDRRVEWLRAVRAQP